MNSGERKIMSKYEVSIDQCFKTDTIRVKIRTQDWKRKKGFIIEMSEEWVLSQLYNIAEGETYPTVNTSLPVVKSLWKPDNSNKALGLLLGERQRQKAQTGYSDSHDDNFHADGTLADAAAIYASPLAKKFLSQNLSMRGWPYNIKDSHLDCVSDLERLVRAGGLIIAEIERLMRAQVSEEASKG